MKFLIDYSNGIRKEIEYLEDANAAQMVVYINYFEEIRSELMKEKALYLSYINQSVLKNSVYLKFYVNFLHKLHFNNGPITSINYFTNLDMLKSAYKTYLRILA